MSCKTNTAPPHYPKVIPSSLPRPGTCATGKAPNGGMYTYCNMLALDLDGQFWSETLPTGDGTLVVALETI